MREREGEARKKEDERQQELVKLYSAERSCMREQLAKQLLKQIDDQRADKLQKNLQELDAARKAALLPKSRPANTCPHGKMYLCGYCNRSYQRQYLTRRPRKA